MSTPICRVWDAEQGKYVGIPAIKGDKGDPGPKGDKGEKGDKGAAGQSAYAAALNGGYMDTPEKFYDDLASMQGLAAALAAM